MSRRDRHRRPRLASSLPAKQRYHFPQTHLGQMRATLGDFVIYYEPRRSSGPSSRGGRQAYFATARVTEIVADPRRAGHYYAMIDSYLDFARAVPFRDRASYYESAVRREDGETNKGAFGRAVRLLPEHEHDAIVHAAFGPILDASHVPAPAAGMPSAGFAEDLAEFERPIIERVVSRPFRDAAFSGAIKHAYRDTCAFTRLRIINGGAAARCKRRISGRLRRAVRTRCATVWHSGAPCTGCSTVA